MIRLYWRLRMEWHAWRAEVHQRKYEFAKARREAIKRKLGGGHDD